MGEDEGSWEDADPDLDAEARLHAEDEGAVDEGDRASDEEEPMEGTNEGGEEEHPSEEPDYSSESLAKLLVSRWTITTASSSP